MKSRIPIIACLLCLAPSAPLPAEGRTAAEQPTRVALARRIDALLDHRYPAAGPGGAVLVARGDQILFRGARGRADIVANAALRPDSLFRIGSVTKQFAAAGLLKLVEAGKVKLDDPLARFLPDYPGGDRITILQLLNHTSGVRSYTAIPGYMTGPLIRRDLTTAQLIEAFSKETPSSEPGGQWSYNNSGYVLVGAVIEKASGMPWHRWLEKALFEPLDMRSTGYAQDPRLASRQARGYSHEGDKIVPARPISMTQPHAAGGLVSTLDDLNRWNRALHEGRVLRPETYSRMITPTGKAKDVGYGFGLFTGKVRGRSMLHHGGGIFGFISALAYLPGPDISVVVLENDDRDNDQEGGDSADTLARRLAAMALADPYPEMKSVPVDSATLRGAEGVYLFGGEVTRTLRVVEGKLTSRRGSRGEVQTLVPIAADDFLYPDGFNRLKLQRDGAGEVSGILFFPGGDGPGEIGRRSEDPLPSAGPARPWAGAAFDRLTGSYAHQEAGLTLRVYREGEVLLGRIAGQPPVTLRAKSPTRFDVEETGATVEFPAGDAPASEVTLRQGGREIVLKRAR